MRAGESSDIADLLNRQSKPATVAWVLQRPTQNSALVWTIYGYKVWVQLHAYYLASKSFRLG